MPLKKEPCRNFQRGSCRFGDRCKFLHVTQQQPKSNVFGFGSQTTGMPFQQTHLQQQKPNPFGFGVQNTGPVNGPSNAGGFQQSNGFKPFENKWIRSEQPTDQSNATNHKCTDLDSCKRQIAEDFEHERPLWTLTCYGHYKHLPCDIGGDISYEELRAAAYDDAKRGISLQSIIERERGLLNSKLLEFQNLLRNPHTKQTYPAESNQTPFPAVVQSTPSLTPQNTGNPQASSFGQLGPSLNMTFGVRTPVPSNNAFGQFQGSPGPFASNNSTPSGAFGPQVPVQGGGSPFTSNVTAFGNSGMSAQGMQQPSTVSVSPHTQTSAINQSSMLLNGLGANNAVEQMSLNIGLIDNVPEEVSDIDASIWSKEWKLGEIPEQPPPAAFVRE